MTPLAAWTTSICVLLDSEKSHASNRSPVQLGFRHLASRPELGDNIDSQKAPIELEIVVDNQCCWAGRSCGMSSSALGLYMQGGSLHVSQGLQ